MLWSHKGGNESAFKRGKDAGYICAVNCEGILLTLNTRVSEQKIKNTDL